jgi:predicted P-loop ATPase
MGDLEIIDKALRELEKAHRTDPNRLVEKQALIAIMAAHTDEKGKPIYGKRDLEQRLKEIKRKAALNGAGEGAEDLAAGPRPLSERLPFGLFPHKSMNANGNILIVDHVDNIDALMRGYGVTYQYNVITKDIDYEINGATTDTDSDNSATALLALLTSQCNLNNVPAKHLGMYMVALAERNQYNPVVEYLSALKWDGKSRIADIVERMGPRDAQAAGIALRRTLTQACAAADNAEIGRQKNPVAEPAFEYVLILQGGQGTKKTTGLARLIPKGLRRYLLTSGYVNPKDKDSVKTAVSHWIVELGELDVSYTVAVVSAQKAFLSRREDNIRLPYAPVYSKFKRRTVFIGTVNKEFFLYDATGNRRFYALAVTTFDIELADEERDQLWAEAWHLYANGEQWWPTDEEQAVLDQASEQFRSRSSIEERIRQRFDWSRAAEADHRRMTMTDIWKAINSWAMTDRVPFTDEKIIPEVMMKLWKEHGAKVEDGALRLRTPTHGVVKVHADGGKNAGYLVPPFAGVWDQDTTFDHKT